MTRGNLTVTNALIFDGVGPDLHEGGVRIEDGDIVAVGADVRPGDGDDVIDARLLAHLCDVFLTDAPGHTGQSTGPQVERPRFASHL